MYEWDLFQVYRMVQHLKLCKIPYQLAKEGKSHDYTNVQEKH